LSKEQRLAIDALIEAAANYPELDFSVKEVIFVEDSSWLMDFFSLDGAAGQIRTFLDSKGRKFNLILVRDKIQDMLSLIKILVHEAVHKDFGNWRMSLNPEYVVLAKILDEAMTETVAISMFKDICRNHPEISQEVRRQFSRELSQEEKIARLVFTGKPAPELTVEEMASRVYRTYGAERNLLKALLARCGSKEAVLRLLKEGDITGLRSALGQEGLSVLKETLDMGAPDRISMLAFALRPGIDFKKAAVMGVRLIEIARNMHALYGSEDDYVEVSQSLQNEVLYEALAYFAARLREGNLELAPNEEESLRKRFALAATNKLGKSGKVDPKKVSWVYYGEDVDYEREIDIKNTSSDAAILEEPGKGSGGGSILEAPNNNLQRAQELFSQGNYAQAQRLAREAIDGNDEEGVFGYRQIIEAFPIETDTGKAARNNFQIAQGVLDNVRSLSAKATTRGEAGIATSASLESIPRGPSTPGGIDFRFLPIVTQSMDSLKASMRAMPQSSLQRINLTQEWSDIQRLVNSGITPSAERIKDYLVASCFKGNLDTDIDKIVSCISDILRMQEEACCSTDPILKDILVVLGSGRSGEELKVAFSGMI
jgi:hypothetical protein